MHLFGHVHAQRGYWQVSRDNNTENAKVVGGVEYAKTTNEQGVHELLQGSSEQLHVQFVANTAMMSDRSVQPFAKKKIVGVPRVIVGAWFVDEVGGWRFSHG